MLDSAQHGLARSDEVAEAEARLRRALEAASTLDGEVEGLAAELADFARRYEGVLGELHLELDAADRVVRSLQALEDALDRLATLVERGESTRPERSRARPRRAAQRTREEAVEDPPRAAAAAGPAPSPESPQAILKRLYRKLARLLHPDLARDEGEARRLGDLMARVNSAYAQGDLAALEVMAERHGAADLPPEIDAGERVKILLRRAETLERVAASLRREKQRLVASDTHRLMQEQRRCEEAGEDLLARSRGELAEEIAAARADVRARWTRVDRAAARLSRARSRAMTQIVKTGSSALRRGFDPLQESAVVRAGASRLERARATSAARELARWMEDAPPWQVALTLLAFFAEDAGGRPPPALEGGEAWDDTWEALRPAWPEAPDLPRALEVLPRHLTVGARLQGELVVAGVQLAAAELTTGVLLSLDRQRVAPLARRVLAALGPVETCPACDATAPALHRLRTRGLDEHHGLSCAPCGALLRSYWRYGELDGLEALGPHALSLGLLTEVTVDLAGTLLGFQMSPPERENLTVDRLRKLVAELYLVPYDVDLAAADLVVSGAAGPLGPRAKVGRDAGLILEVARPDLPAEELLELLRVRIERRFKP